MQIKNTYLSEHLERVKARNRGEPEFIQAVTEVLSTLEPVAEALPDLIEAGVFERIVEPERQIMFRVPNRRSPPIRGESACIPPYIWESSNSSDLNRSSKTA